MEGDVVPREVDLVDIDGDGALDAPAFYADQFPLQAYFGDGAGGFRTRETLDITAGRDLRVADIDGDGRPDLLLADRERVRIHRQTGSGFAPAARIVPLPLRGRAGAIALGDIDADGRLDLAVAMDAGAGREAAIALFPQQANRGFRAKHLVATPFLPGVLVFDDLDGDGRVDLVAPHLPRSYILVYAGLPGTLRDVAAFPTFAPAGRAEMAFGDLDGDGRRDIVVARGLQASGLGLSRGRPTVVESDLAIHVGLSPATAAIRVQNDGGTTPSSLASISVDLELRSGTLALGALPSGCGAQTQLGGAIRIGCFRPSPAPGTPFTLLIPLQIAQSPAPDYLTVDAQVFAGGTPDVRPGNNRAQRRLTLWPTAPRKRQDDARAQPAVPAPRSAR